MCGLFGAIVPKGKTASPIILRALAFANRSRGNQSLGFFSTMRKKKSPMVAKFADDPNTAIQTKPAKAVINNPHAWAICGHTRFGTRGAVSEENCHPFTYGSVTLAHNGVVSAPMTYGVDSMLLADLLSRTDPGEATKALGEVSGNFALTWFDSRVNRLYMLAHRNPLSIAVGHDGVFYYSSESQPLSVIVGRKAKAFCEGGFVSFAPDGSWQEHPQFVSKAPDGAQWWTGGTGGNYRHYGSYRDWDEGDCYVRGRTNTHRDLSVTTTSKTVNYFPKIIQEETEAKTLGEAMELMGCDFFEYKRRLAKYIETNDSAYIWCGVPSSQVDQQSVADADTRIEAAKQGEGQKGGA